MRGILTEGRQHGQRPEHDFHGLEWRDDLEKETTWK